MAKELIISANVHEKKVAMLEDGVVTEFYVERRDENQGVVGNLYKGRVMKVLPGMQSAFVDIGLERDAFLYVSDFTEFMEEAEEIDFREVSDEHRPGHRIDDRSRRGDRPRPEHISGINKPTPPVELPRLEEPSTERPVRIEDAVELLAEIADESLIPPPPPEEELTDAELAAPPIETVSVERITDDEPIDLVSAPEAETAVAAEAPEAEEKPKRGRGRKSAEPKKKAAKGEDKPAKGTRKTSKTGGKRASRRGADDEATSEENATPFQRVTDEDVRPDAGDLLKDAIVQEKIIEQVHNAEFQTGVFQAEPEPEWRVGSLRSVSDGESSFQRVVDENAEASSQKPESLSNMETATHETPSEPKSSPFRHLSDVVRGLYGRIQSNASTDESAASEADSSREAINEVYNTDPFATADLPFIDEAKATLEADEDRDAEVRDRGSRGEFAVRRGGRGRRGRGGRREQPAPAPPAPTEEDQAVAATAQDDQSQSHDDTPKEEENIPSEAGETVDTRLADVRPSESRSGDPRGGAHRPQGSRPQQRRPDSRRPDHRRPDLRGQEQRRQDLGPSRRPERGGAPTISELLHEGQEILVQIAKEPIAKKGARITSHIALPGRFIVYMPTVNHIGVSRKIPNEVERVRLKRIVTGLRDREGATGGFIARTACAGHSEQELSDDMRYLLRTWADIRKKAERVKAPALAHRDLDLVQRILRDQMSEEFTAIRIDNEVEYARIVEFVNRVQPKLVKRVKLYTGDQPILEKYGVQAEIDKAVRPRVWLKSGGYIVINQTEALVAIDVNTGKFVGKSDKLEDTITRTNLEAAKEIVRQIRLRDLGGIIVLDLIDMEERKNRQRVMMALQQELSHDRSPSKILSINDFGLVAITRKRVKQSLERTLCTPCPYCQGAGMVKSAQTMCFEILEQAKAASKQLAGASDVMLRVSPHVAESLRTTEREVMEEIEAHFGTPVTIEPDPNLHQEQFDFAVM